MERDHGVGVLGATGYTGAEVVRLLLGHPRANVVALSGRSHAGEVASMALPSLPDLHMVLDDDSVNASSWRARGVRTVFACLPHGTFAAQARPFLQAGMRVVDLSGDFRLRDAAQYQARYHFEHPDPDLLQEAVYGLCEWHPGDMGEVRLVANPGCYATAILLALLPAAKAGLVSDVPLVVTAMSGVSGAGRGARLTTHFGECGNSVSPYRVGQQHAHVGEMAQALAQAGVATPLIFNPHLVPMARGIAVNATVHLARPVPYDEVLRHYRAAYGKAPFVQLVAGERLVETRLVRASNRCDIAVRLDATGRVLSVFSVIDNLMKGAAGQAVQNFNRMQGWAETLGLPRGAIACA